MANEGLDGKGFREAIFRKPITYTPYLIYHEVLKELAKY